MRVTSDQLRHHGTAAEYYRNSPAMRLAEAAANEMRRFAEPDGRLSALTEALKDVRDN